MSIDASRRLDELFDAERAVRDAQADLATVDPALLIPLLRTSISEALAADGPGDAAMRLARIADLLGEIDGAEPVDLLIDVLGSEEPEARLAAGEALEDRAFSRFKEVALGVERALARMEKGNPALTELPFLVAEVPEPGVLALLTRFLSLEDADAAAAAIEALAALGEPDARTALRALATDKRTVDLGDDAGEDTTVTLGELATEAIELLDQVAGAERRARPKR